MGVTPAAPYTIDDKADADYYLSELLAQPQYRSMDEVNRRAQSYIRDATIKEYFINKAKALLNIGKKYKYKYKDGKVYFATVEDGLGKMVRIKLGDIVNKDGDPGEKIHSLATLPAIEVSADDLIEM